MVTILLWLYVPIRHAYLYQRFRLSTDGTNFAYHWLFAFVTWVSDSANRWIIHSIKEPFNAILFLTFPSMKCRSRSTIGWLVHDSHSMVADLLAFTMSILNTLLSPVWDPGHSIPLLSCKNFAELEWWYRSYVQWPPTKCCCFSPTAMRTL